MYDKYAWLHAVSSHHPHLKPLPLAKEGPDGRVQYVCPCFIDQKEKTLVSSALLTPGFINKKTEPGEMLDKVVDAARKGACQRVP